MYITLIYYLCKCHYKRYCTYFNYSEFLLYIQYCTMLTYCSVPQPTTVYQPSKLLHVLHLKNNTLYQKLGHKQQMGISRIRERHKRYKIVHETYRHHYRHLCSKDDKRPTLDLNQKFNLDLRGPSLKWFRRLAYSGWLRDKTLVQYCT